MVTALTPEEQAAVLYWPNIAGIGIIPADTRSKKVSEYEWQKTDLDNIDYEANLQAGLYDNGVAIRLGKCLNSNWAYYSIALDFNGSV